MLTASSATASPIYEFRVFRSNLINLGPEGRVQLSLGVIAPGGCCVEQSPAKLDTSWLGESDLGVPFSFPLADVSAFVDILLDAVDGKLVGGANVGNPNGTYYGDGFVFVDFLAGGYPRTEIAESEGFGAPSFANFTQRSTIERVDFTLTSWAVNGRDWAGTFTFYTPEPSTALLMGLGLLGLGVRRPR